MSQKNEREDTHRSLVHSRVVSMQTYLEILESEWIELNDGAEIVCVQLEELRFRPHTKIWKT
jgi:hypothetical protein